MRSLYNINLRYLNEKSISVFMDSKFVHFKLRKFNPKLFMIDFCLTFLSITSLFLYKIDGIRDLYLIKL